MSYEYRVHSIKSIKGLNSLWELQQMIFKEHNVEPIELYVVIKENNTEVSYLMTSEEDLNSL